MIFEAITIINEEVGYASAYEANGLFKVNMSTYECEYLSLFPQEKTIKKRLHSAAILINKTVYFIPSSAQNISIYNIENGSIFQIPIPKPRRQFDFYNEKFKFIDAKLHGDNLWLFPSTYPGIIKLNINTNQIEVLDDWIPAEGYFFRRALCIEGNMAYIPSGNNNYMLSLNMENDDIHIFQIGEKNHGAMSMRRWRDQYWMAPRLAGAVVCWSPECSCVEEIDSYPQDFTTNRIVFSSVVIWGEQLYLFPASANYILTVKDKKLLICDKWKPEQGSMVEVLFETDTYYYFREVLSDGISSKHYKLAKSDGKITEYRMSIINELHYRAELLNTLKLQKETIWEGPFFSLEEFIKLI